MRGYWTSPRHWGLSVKLPLTIATIVFSVVLVVGAIAVLREVDAARDGLEENAQQLVRSIALQNVENVKRRDYWEMYASLRQQVGQLEEPNRPLLFGAIIDSMGRVLTHTDPSRHRIGEPLTLAGGDKEIGFGPAKSVIRYTELNANDVLLASMPIVVGNNLLATVWLAYDTRFIERRLLEGGLRMSLIAAALATLGAFVGWVISKRMVKPLGDLTRAIGHLTGSDLSRLEPVQAEERDEIGRLALAFNDMTAALKEKKKLEERLRLQEKLAAVGRMVAGVAHEINNPLGGMKNAINSITLFGHDEAKREEGVKLLGSGLQHIEQVVRALLASHQRPQWDPACDPRIFDDLFLLVRPDCEARSIRLRWENALAGPIDIPSTALQQILMNLLSNAIYAMPEGGILTFMAREDRDAFIFVVRDTGPGLSQDQLEQIFEPFFTTRSDGVGLGLWICSELVDTIGGTLVVESQRGGGSTFRVTVPKRTISEDEEPLVGELEQVSHH